MAVGQDQEQIKQQTVEIIPPKPKKQGIKDNTIVIQQEGNNEVNQEKKEITESVEHGSNIDGKEDAEMLDHAEEESQTKIDENEIEYSKTSFIIPSCS